MWTGLPVAAPAVAALFAGILLVAVGYGATFLLPRHFAASGGSEIDAGTVLGAAALGTFFGLLLTGSQAARVGPARCAALGAGLVAAAYCFIAMSDRADAPAIVGGAALGCGWGMVYLAAPMALSRLVDDSTRAHWFLRFGAFQMAGIGISPVIGETAVAGWGLETRTFFGGVAASSCLAALLFLVFDVRARVTSHAAPVRKGAPTMAPRALMRGPARPPIVMVALGAAAFSGVMTFQSSIVGDTGLEPGLYFAAYTVTVVLARWVFAAPLGRLPAGFGIPVLLIVMVAGLGLLLGANAGPARQAAHLCSAILFGIGYGLVYPIIQAHAVNVVDDPALRDGALTLFTVFYFGGLFGFPLLGGWIVVRLGVDALVWTVIAIGTIELALGLRIGRPRHTGVTGRRIAR